MELRRRPYDCSICRTPDDSLRLVERLYLVMQEMSKFPKSMKVMLVDSSGNNRVIGIRTDTKGIKSRSNVRL